MRKRFKRKKKFKVRFLIYIFLLYLMYQVFVTIVLDSQLVTSNEEFVMKLLENANYPTMYEKRNNTLISNLTKLFANFEVNQPTSILESAFHYVPEVDEDTYNIEELETITGYVHDPNPTYVEAPRVLIYNSHQLENYSMENLEAYNITPNVMMTSYLLKEKLNKVGIPTVVLEEDLTTYMKQNNMNHADSYIASRKFVQEMIDEYGEFDLMIDVHRDALSKANSTVVIGDKSYAKVLFVVGLEHDGYQKNLDLANLLNSEIKKLYPSLTRGVLTKKGAYVDGVYNQDLSANSVLIEFGGNENTIDEVYNTVEIITSILKEHLL